MRPRRRFLSTAIPALCALALACGGRDVRAPNVVLITVDTLRADYLGCYGFPQQTSPNLDRLVRQGVLFERAIAASTLTAPSHASIMTSLYVRAHSIGYGNGSTRLTDETTLAMRFHAAGYDTAAFVGNINLNRASGLGRGFDVYDDDLPQAEARREDIFERTADLTTQRALAWLGERGDRPFFLWVHYQDPHGPYTPPPPYDRQFHLAPAKGEVPLARLEKQGGPHGIPAYQAIDGVVLPSEYRDRYAGEIRFFDDWLGKLLAAVDAGDAGRAIVLFTADHGESMGEEDYYFSHGYATTPNLSHVPFVLRAPGLAPARRAEIVHHVDILPTLLDLAGLDVPDGVSGIALGPYLASGAPLPDRRVFSDTGNEVSSYARGEFLRMRIRGKVADFKKGATRLYDWASSSDWHATERPIDPIALLELRRYSAKEKPLQRIDEPIDEETRRRLRALGYVQ